MAIHDICSIEILYKRFFLFFLLILIQTNSFSGNPVSSNSNYPDNYEDQVGLNGLWPQASFGDPATPVLINRIRNSILNTQKSLGQNPEGSFSTVKDRLDYLSTLQSSSYSLNSPDGAHVGVVSVGNDGHVTISGNTAINAPVIINDSLSVNSLLISGDIPWTENNFTPSGITPGYVLSSNGTSFYWKEDESGVGGGGGTVTSVAVTVPSQFSISGSPITSSGTFGITWNNQSQNYIFAGPTSGSGAPTFRSLVDADIPDAITVSGYEPTISAGGASQYYRGDKSWQTLDTSAVTEGTNLYFTDERTDDRVASLIQNGTGIAWSYDDVAGTLTPTISGFQASNSNLTIYAGITPSANVQSLLGAANYSAIRTLLSLVPGTDIQAYNSNLAALAGLTGAADKLPYFTGSGTVALADFSSFGRSLIDDSDASTGRSTLGLGSSNSPTFTNLYLTGDINFSNGAGGAKIYVDNSSVIHLDHGDSFGISIDGANVTINSEEVTYVNGGMGVSGTLTVNGNTVWHTANDGSGSGLDADTIDGHDTSYFATAISLAGYQPLAGNLTALAGLTSAADKLPYFTAANTAALTDLSSFGRSIIDDSDASAVRSTLGLVIGTNVQAYDADLITYAGITPSANVQSLLGAANYSAITTLLSLVPGTDIQAYNSNLAALAGLTSAADKLPYFTGSGTASVTAFTSAARNLLDDADASSMRTTLGVGSLANGGTGGSVTAPSTSGGIVWMNTSQMQVIEGTASASRVLLSQSAAAPVWSTTSYPSSVTAGDIMYASANNTISTLAKSVTATRYLSNTGASNIPAWAQIDLSNGVTGTLPVGNGGTGNTNIYGTANTWTAAQNFSSGAILNNTPISDTSLIFVSHFELNSAAGSLNWVDSVQPTVNGSPAAASIVTDSVGRSSSGNCLTFDGTNDYLTYAISPDVGTSDYSYGIWLKSASTNSATILAKGVGASTYYEWGMLILNTGIIRVDMNNASGSLYGNFTHTSVLDNKWHHIFITVARGGNATLYIDGVSVSTVSTAAITGTLSTAGLLYIGSAQPVLGNGYFSGSLDEPTVFTRLLTASEVRALYSQQSEFTPKQNLMTLAGSETVSGGKTWSSTQQFAGAGFGTSTLNGYLTRYHVASIDGSSAAIQFTDSDTGTNATSGAKIGFDSGENLVIWNYENIAASNTKRIIFGTNNTQRMQINGVTGNVSIGNTNDTYKFDVTGTGRFTSSLEVSGRLTNYLVPSSSSVIDGSIVINPQSSVTANYTMLGIAVNGTQKLRADSDGDLEIAGKLIGDTTIERFKNGNLVPQEGVIFWCRMRGNSNVYLPNVIDAVQPTVTGSPAAASVVTDSGGRSSIGKCLTFDGTDDYLQYGDNYDFNGSTMSLAFWIKTVDTSIAGVINKLQATGANQGYQIHWNGLTNSQVYLSLRGTTGYADATFDTGIDFKDGYWHHFVIVYDKAGANLSTVYVDGISRGTWSLSTASGTYDNSNNFVIGRDWSAGANWSFAGQLDEIIQFDYALTAGQVVNLYSTGTISHD